MMCLPEGLTPSLVRDLALIARTGPFRSAVPVDPDQRVESVDGRAGIGWRLPDEMTVVVPATALFAPLANVPLNDTGRRSTPG